MSLAVIQITEIDRAHRAVYRPPPRLTVSQWADAYRRLSPEASAEPGRWSTDRAAYQRGIMDALNDRAVELVVVMSSAQVGKTEVLLNIIGYYVHQDPSPMLLLQPTLDMAEAFSKDRLAPMVRDTPALRGKIKDPRARDTGNTLLHKQFPGGHVTMAGANSPASLASRPIRVVLCDEVDRYPPSAATEGDPVNLARKRSANFPNRRVVLTSTPTIRNFSRIELAYEQSDQRHYLVRCPSCGHEQRLVWNRVRWPDGEPERAAIHCGECDTAWSEAGRQAAIARGRWVASAEFRGVAGFHLSELYSPWSTPASVAKAFLEAKAGGVELMKTWVNTALGESWEEDGEQVDHAAIMARAEPFEAEVPDGVLVLTAGADIQGDRIELEIVGWGVGEESWSVDYQVLIGDPAQDDVWAELRDLWETARWARADGQTMRLSALCVDSGYLPKRAYQFVSSVRAQHVYPVKGRAGAYPIIEQRTARHRREAKRRKAGAAPESIGVDEAKSILQRRLRLDKPGPGYCHVPNHRDEEWYRQITGEKQVTRYQRGGRPVREWIKVYRAVEALDCRVYAHAALLLLAPKLEPVKKAAPKQAEDAHNGASQSVRKTRQIVQRPLIR